MSPLNAKPIGQSGPAGSSGTVTSDPRMVTLKSVDGRYVLTAISGPDPAEMVGGRGGHEEVQRNRRPAITQWVGAGARSTTVTVWLDAWADQGSVEADLKLVDGLVPQVPTTDPPRLTVHGVPGVPSTIQWVGQGVTISERLRRSDGVTARAQVAFDLLEWRPGDVVIVRESATKRSEVRNGTPAASKPKTYTVRKGDTLAAIAARLLGKASRWPEIKNKDGSKIRNPNALKVGQVLKLPA